MTATKRKRQRKTRKQREATQLLNAAQVRLAARPKKRGS